jgi:acetyltransferase-like isoleucine patch superfamily enzyme
MSEAAHNVREHAEAVHLAAHATALQSWRRTAQRYLLPSFIAALIIYWRDKALVSFSSRVQLSSLVRLGKGCVVKPYSVIQSSGGRVIFGRNCAVSSFNHIAAGRADIVIGDHVRMGPHVTIIGSTREYRRRDQLITEQGFADKGISIGSDVLIGARAVLVDGCEIGDGAVVGVGSIVNGKVPPYAIVFGAPAKVIFWRRETARPSAPVALRR